jgi:hypothetical protein
MTILLLGVVLMLAFQNCGQGIAFRSSFNSSSGNGTGYDGKPYARLGTCAGQGGVISSKVWISDGQKSGKWEYIDCVKSDSALDMKVVQFRSPTSDGRDVIHIDGLEFVSLDSLGLPYEAAPPIGTIQTPYTTIVSCVDTQDSSTSLLILRDDSDGKFYSQFQSPKTGLSQGLVRIYDIEKELPTGCPFGNFNSDIRDTSLPYHIGDLCLTTAPASQDSIDVKYKSELFLVTHVHKMSCQHAR